MAVKLTFESSEKSEHNSSLQCFANVNNEIFITIEADNDYPSFIVLDIPTAIRLQKELRKQIGLAKEWEEQDNGRG